MSTVLPFGRMLGLGTSDDRLLVGTADRYEIASYDSTGRLTRLVRRAGAQVPVTDADIAAVKGRMLGEVRSGTEAQRDRVQGTIEGMTFPSTKPAYEGFVVGDEGGLWVEEYAQPARDLPVRYDVFDVDGRWRGQVTFPPHFSLHHAGPGYALGVWSDADDAERVRLYHLKTKPE